MLKFSHSNCIDCLWIGAIGMCKVRALEIDGALSKQLSEQQQQHKRLGYRDEESV